MKDRVSSSDYVYNSDCESYSIYRCIWNVILGVHFILKQVVEMESMCTSLTRMYHSI